MRIFLKALLPIVLLPVASDALGVDDSSRPRALESLNHEESAVHFAQDHCDVEIAFGSGTARGEYFETEVALRRACPNGLLSEVDRYWGFEAINRKTGASMLTMRNFFAAEVIGRDAELVPMVREAGRKLAKEAGRPSRSFLNLRKSFRQQILQERLLRMTAVSLSPQQPDEVDRYALVFAMASGERVVLTMNFDGSDAEWRQVVE